MRALHPLPAQRRIACIGAAAALLAAALLWRRPLEASMASHMLLQMPAIFVAGLLAARAGGSAPGWLCGYDRYGLPGLLALSFVLGYWMIPKAIDQVLVAPTAEALKFASLFGAGLLAAGSFDRANPVIQLFFVGNAAWMTAIVGLLYQDNPARLCNFYLLDDQVRAGQGLVLLSVVLPALWLWRVLRNPADRRLLA